MTALQRNRDHHFFLAFALLISAVAFAGFAFTYFGPIIGNTYPPSGIPLHLHGWSFFLWYALLPGQAVLIANRKYALHMRLGRLSVVLVVAMVLSGILVLSVRVDEALRNGAPLIWLHYGPLILSNLVLFVVFYAAAVHMALNSRFQAHKRLIMVASAIALGAAFSRLIMFTSGFHPLSVPIGVIGCSIFIFVGVAYDWIANRAVHPAYWAGLVVLFAVELPLLPQINPEMVEWINQGLAVIGERLGFLYQPEPTIEFN